MDKKMRDNEIISIDEAIRHCYEVYHERDDMCKECREEHRQLAKWLEELNECRETINRKDAEIEELKEVIDDMSAYFPCCTNCEGKYDGLFNDKCINLINPKFCAQKGLENIAQILRENEEQKAEIERLRKENEFHRKTITENAQRALEVTI